MEQGFYAPLGPGAGAYLERGDPLGEFIVATRSRILRGNPAELQRTKEVYAFDVMASFFDAGVDHPQSLPRRLSGLQMPTLFLFGLREAIYLMPHTHHSSLIGDVIQPLYREARALGSPIDIKLYPQGSHLMHVALQEPMSRDILQFLQEGCVEGGYCGEDEAALA